MATEADKNEHANGSTSESAPPSIQSQDSYKSPDTKTLQEAGELKVQDKAGKELTFKSLYEDQAGQQLIVFIRHFFCGVCKIPPRMS